LERSELAFRETFERVVEAMNQDRTTIEQLP